MEFIKLSEISSKIMTLIDEAESVFVAVSPYVKLGQWDKMRKKLQSLSERSFNYEIYIREGEENSIREVNSLGLNFYLVKNLHCKFYFNEKSAIITSMNLLYSSEVNSIEMGYITENQKEYSEIIDFYNRYIKINDKPKKMVSLVDEIKSIDNSITVFQDDKEIIIRSKQCIYKPFIWSKKKENKLRIKCSIDQVLYDKLKTKKNTFHFKNIDIEFDDARFSFPSTIYATGNMLFYAKTISEALLSESEVIVSMITEFIEIIEKNK